ncbi:MAG TPA: serine/threonine-protein kinase [Gaiellaceae bacterium]
MVESVIAGRYRLEQQIGSGGMSEVWSATDLELDRTVAVKLLGADADPARFDREARAAAGLAHANVCALYDYGRADRRRFMVLEYLPGGSLDDRMASGRPLPDEQTRRIAAEIAAGLAHAHERGVVHRDLKPANILFDGEGRAKIADFGIARTEDATGLTEAGTILGTAAYISPEQAAGRPAAPASDVYAFGVILFRMLTGRLPFESPDAIALAAMHRDLPVPPVSDFRPDAPPLLDSVASAALAKSPADRPRDGRVLVRELAGSGPATVVADEPGAVTEVLAPVVSPARRSGLLLGLAVAVVAAAGVGLATAVTLGNGTSTVPPTTANTKPESTALPVTEPSRPEPSTSQTTEETRPLQATAASTAPEPTIAPSTSSAATTAVTSTTPPVTMPPPTSTAVTPPLSTEVTTTAPPATDTVASTVVTDTAVTTEPATTPLPFPG